MTKKTKGRDRLHGGAAQKTFDTSNHTEQDPLTGGFSLAKSSHINRQQKHGWQRGRK